MTENSLIPAGVLAPALTGDVDVSMNRDDIAAVAVARAEEMVQARHAECRDAAAAARKAAEEQGKLIEKACQAAAKSAFAKTAEQAAAVFKAAGVPAAKITVTINGSLNSTSGRYDYAPTDPEGKKALGVACQLNVSAPGASLSMTRRLPLPKAAREALTERERLGEVAATADAEATEWKRREARMPQFERQAKATLAEYRLRKSEHGSAMLDHLLDTVAPTVLRLPAR